MHKKTGLSTGRISAVVMVMAAVLFAGCSSVSTKWDKTFPKSSMVIHKKVTFKNRYNITLVADLYMPKNFDKTKKYPAIVTGHPYGGVKEQSSGLYAMKMAERGFIGLAFDNSFCGESGGTPRRIASGEIFAEDFSAAVDYIGTRSYVDRNKIGVIGICGSGCFSLSATAIDHRIRAIATVSMYDIGEYYRSGLGKTVTYAKRMKMLDGLGQLRWKEFVSGKIQHGPGYPRKLPKNPNPVMKEFYEYYAMPRGYHPRSRGFSFSSMGVMMNFYPFSGIKTISPRPILLIAGEKAHSRYFSEEAYKLAKEPKELYIVKGAGHVDLYDRVNLIPFGKLESFFKMNLK